jgi:uncharacterized protein YdeI (YjbR/CyaY-like superfamily)
MEKTTVETFCPTSHKEWRQWLRKNHKTKESVWLVLYKKKANMPSIDWDDAVEQALCFGWIDGKRLSVSDEQFKQFFSKRKAKGTWSKINKERVERLIQQRQMTKAGHEAIEVSRKNGAWTILDDVEKLAIPKDLEEAFKKTPEAKENFHLLAKSIKKLLLMNLKFAKRPQTRAARVADIIARSLQKKTL